MQRAEVGLLGEQDAGRDRAGAAGAHADLLDALLAGDVEDVGRLVAQRHRVGDRGDERALADARLAGEQHDLPGDQPAAEDPVELRQPGQLARGAVGDDLLDRTGRVLRRLARARPS